MGLLRRWQARHLFLAWVLYWIALVAIGLRSALGAVLRGLSAPEGQGSISASVENGTLILRVVSSGATWSGSSSLTTAALWVAGPPLLLWLLWLVTRRAPARAHDPERDYRIT
jgi:hypothetical protein